MSKARWMTSGRCFRLTDRRTVCSLLTTDPWHTWMVLSLVTMGLIHLVCWSPGMEMSGSSIQTGWSIRRSFTVDLRCLGQLGASHPKSSLHGAWSLSPQGLFGTEMGSSHQQGLRICTGVIHTPFSLWRSWQCSLQSWEDCRTTDTQDQWASNTSLGWKLFLGVLVIPPIQVSISALLDSTNHPQSVRYFYSNPVPVFLICALAYFGNHFPEYHMLPLLRLIWFYILLWRWCLLQPV